jgi:hypothetical protein
MILAKVRQWHAGSSQKRPFPQVFKAGHFVRSAAFGRRRSELTLSGRNKLGVMHGIEQRIDDPVERLSRATPF